ncbi:MAG: two-component system, OmpR family, response regulator MprA [Chloroflexota bacterium]|nr:two-component system, OmpR family, response regulator MprA [Chloroflexota bacterium]
MQPERRPAAESGELRFSDLTLDLATREVRRDGVRLERPTPREFELLEYMLRNPRQVLSRSQILDAVWGYTSDTTENAVDVYIAYLRRKLEARGGARLIHTVFGTGYRLTEL